MARLAPLFLCAAPRLVTLLALALLASPTLAASSQHPVANATRHPATKAKHAARHHATASLDAPTRRGPPPPAWTIRPRHHQTAVTAEGFTDGDPPPWNARSGCVNTATPAGDIVTAIGVGDPDLRRLYALSDAKPHAGYAGCVPYALLTNDADQVLALALLASEGAETLPGIITFSHESPDAPFTLRTAPWLPPGPATSVVLLDIDAALERGGAAGDVLPPELLFEVAFLARSLEQDLATVDSVVVRVAFQAAAEPDSARLLSIELLDSSTARVLRQALWVPREGMPGGYFTPTGESLEPVFWTNPVNFRYISRGVGAIGSRPRRAATTAAAPGRRPAVSRKVRSSLHIGVDFIAPAGTPAIAVADGTVLFMGYFGGYGNLVIVQHPGGYTTHYGHLRAFAPGMTVGTLTRRGATLGYVGATGLATAPHLHFEIRHAGDYLDPLDQTLPMSLWLLRRADYAPLARQIMATSAVLSALSPPPPAETPEPPDSQPEARQD